MNDLVTIIIPAYNVQDYIFRAIESSINQTYDNIEIVIVDDGSTDNTKCVLEKYRNNIKVNIICKENGGVSSARNSAVDACSGKWLLFLDSDDWLEKNAVEKLLELADGNDSYLICCDRYFAYFNREGDIYKERQRDAAESIKVDLEDALVTVGNGKYNLQSSCYKLFSSSIIKNNHLKFDTSIYHGEDGLFVYEYLQYCEGIIFSTEPLWNILERPGSATTSAYNSKWLTMIDAINVMLSECKYPDVVESLNVYKSERLALLAIAYYKNQAAPKKDEVIIKKSLKEMEDIYCSNHSLISSIKYKLLEHLPNMIIRKLI